MHFENARPEMMEAIRRHMNLIAPQQRKQLARSVTRFVFGRREEPNGVVEFAPGVFALKHEAAIFHYLEQRAALRTTGRAVKF